MMNHDEETRSFGLSPELEARVVAWVLGEASDFEAAEIERLAAENPEVAVFSRRIAAVHGLLGETTHPEKEPLRLAPGRRAKLLASIGGGASGTKPSEPTPSIVVVAAKPKRRVPAWVQWSSIAAACFAVGMVVFIPTVGRVRETARRSTEASERRQREQLALIQQMETAKRASTEKDEAANTFELAVDEPAPAASVSSGAFTIPVNRSPPRAPAVAPPERITLEGIADSGSAGIGQTRSYGTGISNRPTSTTFGLDDDRPGYKATSTLSGARMSIPLPDLAGEFNVFTEERLADKRVADAGEVSAAQSEAERSAANTKPKKEGTENGQAGKETGPPYPPREDVALPPIEETHTSKEPVSTFSLHVSDVSFRLAQAALARGEVPDPSRVRPEEFYNAFDYGDPAPAVGEKIACRIEQAAHPFLQQRNLVRIAMRVAATGRGAGQPLRLTLLLDTSGSMEREDRVASVRRAVEVLAGLLGPDDRVTLIGFARQARLLADSLPGDQAAQLVDLIARTPAEGGTNLEEALDLAGELAQRQHDPAAQNRIVLVTDGAANLGSADPRQLAGAIEALRQQGIAFDACGVGTDGLDDAILEALTRKGDGRYYVLDSAADADAGFAAKLAGAFRPAAQNVKLQVRFNPARVGAYRLIGFEQHRLREEDFRNDAVDAAELASNEPAVALYEVEVLPQGEGAIGEVFVRFRDTAGNQMVERSWPIAHETRAPSFDKATPTLQLAGVAGLFADGLRGAPSAGAMDLDDLAPIVDNLRSRFARNVRVQELVTMFGQLRRMETK